MTRTMRKRNKTRRYHVQAWTLNDQPLFKVTVIYVEECGYRGPIIRSAHSNFTSLAQAEASVDRAVRMCERHGWTEAVSTL